MPEKSLAQANPPLSLLAIIPIVLTGFFYLYEYILRVYPSVFRIEIEQFYAFSGASGFGFFASSYYYLYTPLQLFVGILADKFRLQSLLVFSISGCLSGLLLLLVPIDIAAFLGRMLLGMASAAGFVLIIKATSLYAPRHYFAFFCGLGICLGYMGALIATPMSTFLVKLGLGWRETNILFILFALIILVVILIGFRITKHTQNTSQSHSIPPKPVSFLELAKQFGKLVRNSKLLYLGFISFFAYIPSITFSDLWGISYLKEVQQLSAYQASVVIALIYFGWLIGSAFNGWMLSYIRNPKKIILTGLSIAMVAMSMILYLDLPYFIISTLAVIIGLSNSVQILCFALVSHIAPKAYVASAASIVNFITMFSGIIFQSAIGYFLTETGSYQITFLVIPASFVISFYLAYRLFKQNSFT